MERSSSAPRRLINFPILGSSPGSSSSSPIQNANMVTHQEGELPGTHTVAMEGSSSEPPTLIDFIPLTCSGPRSSSSLIQSVNMVTTGLPRQRPKRKRSSVVSTELVLHDPWKIQKTLTESDLGQLSRLLLPLDCVENFVLNLMTKVMASQVRSKEGMQVVVRDTDKRSKHKLVFGFWASSKCYVLKGGWIPRFVNRQRLVVGDKIGMFWDPNSTMFHFTVLHRVARGKSHAVA